MQQRLTQTAATAVAAFMTSPVNVECQNSSEALEQLFLEDKQTFKRCPRLCQAPCKDHLSCCWIFLATLSNHLCAGCSACKVSSFAVSFLCHVSALKSPVSFPPPCPPSGLVFVRMLFQAEPGTGPHFKNRKNRGQGTELLGGKRQRRETAAAGDGAPRRGKTNLNISGLFKISLPSYIYSSARGCSD